MSAVNLGIFEMDLGIFELRKKCSLPSGIAGKGAERFAKSRGRFLKSLTNRTGSYDFLYGLMLVRLIHSESLS